MERVFSSAGSLLQHLQQQEWDEAPAGKLEPSLGQLREREGLKQVKHLEVCVSEKPDQKTRSWNWDQDPG